MMRKRNNLKSLVIGFSAIALHLNSGVSSAQSEPASNIVYDAEYVILQQQRGDVWAVEDAQVQEQLAALRAKYGKPPNIVHIMWDDNSLGEVGIPLMNKVLGFDTPHINQMAAEGISFSRMYTEPSCTPTRAAALTGRLSVRSGMFKVGFPPDGMGLPAEEVTIAEVLSEVGYKTAFVGKGHQGDIEESYLNNQGFDFANFSLYNQFPLMTWQRALAVGGAIQGLFPEQQDRLYTIDETFRPLAYINQVEGRKGEPARVFGGTSITDYKQLLRINQRQVIDYIAENADAAEPFYLAYWPHVYDLARKPQDITTSAGTWYAESIVELDRDIGEILAALKAHGIAENTLVIAMADNGPMHELAPLGPHEAIFRGGKGDYLEGGIRVPAFAWWPGTIAPNQTVGDIIAVHDLFTTFASLGGGMGQLPTDRVIDGVDQTALLVNGDGHSRRDYYHIYTGDVLAASIKQQFKRVWLDDRPGLVGDAFHDLYKDSREEHGDMPPFLWAWAPFDHMRTRHEALIEEYPHRAPRHGRPYQGLEDLPEAAAQLARTVPVP